MTDQTHLASIAKPGRYLGHEYNSFLKNWGSTKVRFALVFPDLYEIGMSHQGLQILYHLLNRQQEILAERCYCPDTDLERILRQKNQALTSLESSHPLRDFDVIGITLPYELCYTNILTILSLSDIPLYSRDRDSSFPLILGGGAGSFNPEPVADFFDAILLGDGEEAVIEIGHILSLHKAVGGSKTDLLNRLGNIEGIYIPAHFQPEYDDFGNIQAIHRTAGKKDLIRRRILSDLSAIEHLKQPIVPNAKIVHDRLGIEIARGCTRGCRFCQAGITYRPVRERSPEQIMELAESGIDNSGFEELALLSLSTGDYSCLDQVLPALMDQFSHRYISIAMPSMRVGTLTPSVMEQIKRVRKTGFTLAPEAGSERLRRVINKGITEEDLLATCNDAFSAGWQSIKLYFMIGLPSETDEDILAIAQLAKKILTDHGKGGGRGKRQITISVGTFVPKPHTPFQWARQLSPGESMDRIQQIKRSLPSKGCNLRYHGPRQSFLEGVFSRGDRRLAELIEKAWSEGARFDGWDEHFDLARWQKAAESCGLSLESYLHTRPTEKILAWQHLSSGVTNQFLHDELAKAATEEYTPDCRYHACQKCGLCDFKTLMPVVCNRTQTPLPQSIPVNLPKKNGGDEKGQTAGHYKYIVHYTRVGNICYLGHLEMLQGIFRTLRRTHIETNFSQGFNPSPKISFGPALAAGTESLAEFFIMDLPKPLKNCASTAAQLNKNLVPGLTITKIEAHSGKVPQSLLTSYTLTLARTITEQEKERTRQFLSSERYSVAKTRKGKTIEIDIRPLITFLNVSDLASVQLEMVGVSAQPGIKPIEALAQILGLTKEETLATKILKTAWRAMDTDSFDKS
ncbi:MAG: TIGR03960 family B12-binding radical SAM protein [Proteobacteria bacterium]|nr:TIGR03960 family B12-binding radical SAM protein [Pseudomonadota bacterium]